MKIDFLKDALQTEPKLMVVAAERDEKIDALMEQLERMYSDTVKGYVGERVQILKQAEILRVYAEGQRVLCQTEAGVFLLRARLYEMEEQLDPQVFVRISKCEIVNTAHILRLDVTLSGTVGVQLTGGIKTYTSRRYMKKLKAVFGL